MMKEIHREKFLQLWLWTSELKYIDHNLAPTARALTRTWPCHPYVLVNHLTTICPCKPLDVFQRFSYNLSFWTFPRWRSDLQMGRASVWNWGLHIVNCNQNNQTIHRTELFTENNELPFVVCCANPNLEVTYKLPFDFCRFSPLLLKYSL